ncbi:Alpha_amylase [Hexamita inflata]|uniref:Alpha_amylase n=1 Tax=Hexamita inflata TaxID=28002 RepID=A0ABP1J1U7_9EUKA
MFSLISLFAFPDPNEFRKRRVYQIVIDRFASSNPGLCDTAKKLEQYCGGDLRGIISQLDYIKNLGYNAIALSSTLLQVNSSEAYHGFWPADFYHINPHFGTSQDLNDLITSAHDLDMWVISDVQYNSVGLCESPDDFSCIKTFPLPEYYHKNCQDDVEKCRNKGLPDLDQSHQFVKAELLNWSQWFQKEFDFDGFRITAVDLVQYSFWQELKKITPWLTIGEVYYNFDNSKYLQNGDFSTVFNQELESGLITVFDHKYSMMWLSMSFKNQVEEFGPKLADMGVFIDNDRSQSAILRCS